MTEYAPQNPETQNERTLPERVVAHKVYEVFRDARSIPSSINSEEKTLGYPVSDKDTSDAGLVRQARELLSSSKRAREASDTWNEWDAYGAILHESQSESPLAEVTPLLTEAEASELKEKTLAEFIADKDELHDLAAKAGAIPVDLEQRGMAEVQLQEKIDGFVEKYDLDNQEREELTNEVVKTLEEGEDESIEKRNQPESDPTTPEPVTPERVEPTEEVSPEVKALRERVEAQDAQIAALLEQQQKTNELLEGLIQALRESGVVESLGDLDPTIENNPQPPIEEDPVNTPEPEPIIEDDPRIVPGFEPEVEEPKTEKEPLRKKAWGFVKKLFNKAQKNEWFADKVEKHRAKRMLGAVSIGFAAALQSGEGGEIPNVEEYKGKTIDQWVKDTFNNDESKLDQIVDAMKQNGQNVEIIEENGESRLKIDGQVADRATALMVLTPYSRNL